MNNFPSKPSRGPAGSADERLRHLPPDARAAYQQFQATRDAAALDMVVFAVVADYAPQPPEKSLGTLPGAARLIEDLGFDSLAITEMVFFTEELFGISISNDEIIRVRTLDDLKAFVRRKVGDRAAAA